MKDNEMKRLMRLAKQGLPVVYAESGEEPVVIVPLSVYEAMSELPTLEDVAAPAESSKNIQEVPAVRDMSGLDDLVDGIEADAMAAEEILQTADGEMVEVPTLFSKSEPSKVSLKEKLSGSSFQPSRPDLQGDQPQKLAENQPNLGQNETSGEGGQVQNNQGFEDQFFLEPID